MVGYMKRYDPAVERMAQELERFSQMRFARSTTAEYPLKWYVGHYPIVRGADIDSTLLASLEADDEARVTAAIGIDDPTLRYAYRHSLLDSMIHDINLMRGLLGEPKSLRFANVAQSGVSLFIENAVVRKTNLVINAGHFSVFDPGGGVKHPASDHVGKADHGRDPWRPFDSGRNDRRRRRSGARLRRTASRARERTSMGRQP